MKISINRKIINGPWGGGNQILNLFVDYLNKKGHIVSDILSPDTEIIYIWESNPSPMSFGIDLIRRHVVSKPSCKVVHRINDNGLHRNDSEKRDQWFKIANKLASVTIFISEWIKEYYAKLGINGIVINNGADRSIFLPDNHVRNREDPLKIVTHHWSDNINKGYETYKILDKFCHDNPKTAHFRFIGRTKCSNLFSKSCEKIGEQKYSSIPQYLRTEDVYVTASMYEAGGCHIVEGMSCGLIPLVKKGGGGTECYAKGFGNVFNNIDELLEQICTLSINYDLFKKMRETMVNQYTYSAEEMCEKYYKSAMEYH